MTRLSLLYVLPLLYFAGAVAAWWSKSDKQRWMLSEAFAVAAFVIGLFALILSIIHAVHGDAIDKVGLCMALLISLLGCVIVRYSRCYLAGEEHQRSYASAMLFTLASVTVVTVTQNLGVLIAGWIASSLSLHQLLMFFHERSAAQIVAHKKFLASRLAEVCFVIAAALLFINLGTLSLPAIAAAITSAALPSWPLQVAAILIVLGAILKSAQLPVHGWLIQVMEAPTPVSALLHAGIVNLGGFALIRLATLISSVPMAQAILVIISGLTAVSAGLVMTTRISIKVRLAWSTCAQMGFMLMECGLGLYDLALLHLLAHSLYKAYAFLSAGEAVLDYKRRSLLPPMLALNPRIKLLANISAVPIALIIGMLSLLAWNAMLPHFELPLVAMLILAIGMAPLLWARGTHLLLSLLFVIVLTQVYFTWHLVFGALTAQAAVHASTPLTLCVCVLFVVLFTVQVWLRAYPQGHLAKTLYPWVYYGFYLDERFARITFRVWPLRIQHKVDPRYLHSISYNPLPGELA